MRRGERPSKFARQVYVMIYKNERVPLLNKCKSSKACMNWSDQQNGGGGEQECNLFLGGGDLEWSQLTRCDSPSLILMVLVSFREFHINKHYLSELRLRVRQ